MTETQEEKIIEWFNSKVMLEETAIYNLNLELSDKLNEIIQIRDDSSKEEVVAGLQLEIMSAGDVVYNSEPNFTDILSQIDNGEDFIPEAEMLGCSIGGALLSPWKDDENFNKIVDESIKDALKDSKISEDQICKISSVCKKYIIGEKIEKYKNSFVDKLELLSGEKYKENQQFLKPAKPLLSA